MRMSYLQFCVLLFTVILTNYTFGQGDDSFKPKEYQNFFGSLCPADTFVEAISKNDKCVFYANEFILCRHKRKKVKWMLDLKTNQNIDYMCMVVISIPKKKFKGRKLFILSYVDNNQIGKRVFRYRTGKEITLLK